MVRILHLSDIHFGQERKGQRVFHDDVRDQLVTDAGSLLSPDKKVDLILINGDIAFAGKQEEYDRAISWIEKLITACRCDVTSVRTVPGNHDVDFDLISKAARLVHTQLRGASEQGIQQQLHEYVIEKEEVNSIFPKLRTYSDFARGYNSAFEAYEVPRWILHRPLNYGYSIRIVGLCSVQVSDDGDTPGKMVLGEKQFIFPEDRTAVTLVTVHHPLNWCLDKIRARGYLHSRASIILTGHEHIPDFNKIVMPRGERIEISSGAVTSTEHDSAYVFSYNLLELDLDTSGNERTLNLTIWPRIWNSEHPGFEPDFSRANAEKFVQFKIKCELDNIPAEQDNVLKAKDGGRGEHLEPDDNNFGRLMHFFWHYLTWQQRLTVLVKSEILPNTADRRIPQSLELEALERAKTQDKLGIVWNQVMQFVPEDKRKANPFPG